MRPLSFTHIVDTIRAGLHWTLTTITFLSITGAVLATIAVNNGVSIGLGFLSIGVMTIVIGNKLESKGILEENPDKYNI